MYKKTCNKCYQPSFSCSKIGEWICPICSHDISNLKAKGAELRTRNTDTIQQLLEKYHEPQTNISDSKFTTHI